jgi:hypothetical protein
MTRKIRYSLIPIIILIIPPSQIYSQSFSSFPDGLGIEIGGGQNNLFWSGIGPTGPFGYFPVDRTNFHLTPNIRISYYTSVTDGFSVLPFIGYNDFGGTATIGNIQSRYSFYALEAGFVFLHEFSNLSFGAGFKEKLNLHVLYEPYHGGDYTKLFPSWSDDAGLRASYSITPITFSIESWFGLTNLGGKTGYSIHEDHYRFLVGYTF